jgi:hypothetical protein
LIDVRTAGGSRDQFLGRGGAAWGLHLASSLYLLARIVKKTKCHLRAPRPGIGSPIISCWLIGMIAAVLIKS